jgi:hypothetical protein
VLFEPVRLRATVAEMAEKVLERYGTSRSKPGRPRRAPTR